MFHMFIYCNFQEEFKVHPFTEKTRLDTFGTGNSRMNVREWKQIQPSYGAACETLRYVRKPMIQFLSILEVVRVFCSWFFFLNDPFLLIDIYSNNETCVECMF